MSRAAALAIALTLSAACDNSFASQRKAIKSIQATTTSVLDAWLSGQVSTPYARVALERTYQLAEETRTELTKSPTTAADLQAAALAETCGRLSRHTAALAVAIARNDRGAAEKLLAQVKGIDLP